MISLDSRCGGRLGNKILQHSVALIFSKKYKMRIKNFNVDFPFKLNVDIIDKEYNSVIRIQNEDLIRLLESKEGIQSNINLDDYFQLKEFLVPYKQQILDCLDIPPSDPIDGTIIHYRIGDLMHYPNVPSNELIIDIEYFEKCISFIENTKNRYITTDSPEDSRVKYLCEKYGFELITLSPRDTILYASRFSHKILSLGTFSWWIGFLGDQTKVYHPDPTEYKQWHGEIFCFDHWNIVST